MHPFAAATAPSLLVLLLLLLFSLSTTQYSVADANYNEISPISTDSHINQVIFDPDHPNSSLPLLIHNNNNIDNNKNDQTFEFNVTALRHTYLMSLQVRTEDNKFVKAYATPDTGSDLIWLEPTCKTTTANACIKEPKTPFKCRDKDEDEYCKKMWIYLGMQAKCIESTDHKDKYCGYKIVYKDGAGYEGYLGKGTFSDSHDQKLENMKYGVSTGTKEENSKGVVGLGRGNLSLFQQLNNSARARVEFKFSYCLPQYEKKVDSNKNAQYATGKLVFGSQVNTNPEKSTPLLDEKAEQYCKTRYYCVNLTSIYVKPDGEKQITVKLKSATEVMVIDSGHTFTSLRGELFDEFLAHVKEEISSEVVKLDDDYEHCFLKGSAAKLEKVSLGFKGTKDELKVELKWENFFDLMEKDGKDYRCLTVKKGKGDPKAHILGSKAQMDFKVAFDVPNKMVSFDKVETCNQEKEKKNSNDGVE